VRANTTSMDDLVDQRWVIEDGHEHYTQKMAIADNIIMRCTKHGLLSFSPSLRSMAAKGEREFRLAFTKWINSANGNCVAMEPPRTSEVVVREYCFGE